MAIIDGKEIASEIYAELAKKVAGLTKVPKMAIITCNPNFETTKYLELKKRKAEQIGVTLNIIEMPEDTTTTDFITCIESIAPTVDGVVVQLPLPTHINREQVLSVVPKNQDPDCFQSGDLLAPVVGAIDEIAKRATLNWPDKKVAVVGYGRLVGKPVAEYLKAQGAVVTVLTEASENFKEVLITADVVVSGVGHSGLITSDIVKSGVIVFDAGTSEEGGELKGDVSPTVANKASLFTPVPGGIGPITIAILLRNLVTLASR
jgi:methylenetetrahydrofolate dehydrogenase (NADP+) / methenyltetrahydrofolate cyclohydrolase